VHACYNPSTGAVKLNVKGTCPFTGAKTPITWSVQGPQGPPGPHGDPGTGGLDETYRGAEAASHAAMDSVL
jgi:hypothetical protein